jgi:hypothetical protein
VLLSFIFPHAAFSTTSDRRHRTLGSYRSLFGSRDNLTQPRKVRALFSVKTTSTKTPEAVKAEVLRVVSEAGYEVKEKGFVITVKKYSEKDGKKIELQIKFEVRLSFLSFFDVFVVVYFCLFFQLYFFVLVSRMHQSVLDSAHCCCFRHCALLSALGCCHMTTLLTRCSLLRLSLPPQPR